MTEKFVRLPDRSNYKLAEVVHAIAMRIPPTPGEEKGIDCISRKLLDFDILKNEPKYLFRNMGLVSSLPLSEADRKKLKRLLSALPEVTHYMTEAEIENFFDQYYVLPNRPQWEPAITSPRDRKRMRDDFESRIATDVDFFLAGVRERSYRLFDERTVLVDQHKLYSHYAQKSGFLLREDAEKFIGDLGLTPIFVSEDNSSDAARTRKSSNPKAAKGKEHLLNANGASSVSGLVKRAKKEVHRNGKKRWTDDELEKLSAYRDAHTLAATMLEYDLSDGYIRRLVRRWNKRTTLSSAWPGIVRSSSPK